MLLRMFQPFDYLMFIYVIFTYKIYAKNKRACQSCVGWGKKLCKDGKDPAR